MDLCTRPSSGRCGDVTTIRIVQRVCSVTAGCRAPIGSELAITVLAVVVVTAQSFRRRRCQVCLASGERNLGVGICPGERRSRLGNDRFRFRGVVCRAWRCPLPVGGEVHFRVCGRRRSSSKFAVVGREGGRGTVCNVGGGG